MFPASINVPSYLDGTTGFVVNGPGGSLSNSVSNGGDINGDGRTDLIVGAINSNKAYVIYGQDSIGAKPIPASVNPTVYLANGTKGFVVNGPGGFNSMGYSVSNGGDINGDGRTDLIIGATSSSKAYVIYGQDSTGTTPFPASINATTYLSDDTKGFVINGPGGGETGFSVSNAGDVNGDGRTDLIVGARTANQVYVIYGQDSTGATPFPASINVTTYLADGTKGFTVNGPQRSETGWAVSNDGDINGDGRTDLIVGAITVSQTYVMYGQDSAGATPFPASINATAYLADGTKGFVINAPGYGGYSVTNGRDINGDNKTDLIIGAFLINQAYVIYGQDSSGSTPFPASINIGSYLADGTKGFTVTGASMAYVSNGGDMNGDSRTDLIVGAPNSNRAYVIYGQDSAGSTPFPAIVNVGSYLVNGTKGFVIIGPVGSNTGQSVSNGGDINGDGKTDLVVGTNGANQAYVIYGGPPPSPSPSPSSSASPSKSPSSSVSASPSPSASPSSGPSLSLSPSASSSTTLVPSNGFVGVPSAVDSTIITSPANPLASSSVEGQFSMVTVRTTGASTQLGTPSSEVASGTLQTRTITTATKTKKTKTSKPAQTTTTGTQTELVSRSIAKTDTPAVPASRTAASVAGATTGRITTPTENFSSSGRRHKTSSTGRRLFGDIGIGDLINGGNQLRPDKHHLRETADDSSSLRNEPMWISSPLLHTAQLPLAQTGMHLMQQGYNRIIDWFQGTGSDEGIQIQELLPTGQVAGFLQDYNKVSQELETILQQIESDESTTDSMLSWLKESIVEHRAQGQQLVQQPMVTQASIKSYLENIQTVAKDVTELVENLAEGSSIAVAYAQIRLANVNQALTMLSADPVVVAKDQATLKANVRAHLQANAVQQQAMNSSIPQAGAGMNISTPLTADVMGLLV
jgi:hypothetical protein